MHTKLKPKIGQRLLSMFLSVVMLATSTTLITVTNIIQSDPVIALAESSLNNNNLVMGPQYMSIDNMENDAEAAYNFQMLRFSIIQSDEDNPSGYVDTGDSILVNNPITICNASSDVLSYNASCAYDDEKVRQLVNPNYSYITTAVGHALNSRKNYIAADSESFIFSLAYGMHTVISGDSPPYNVHWEASEGSISGAYFSSYYVPVYYDKYMPEIIGTGSLKKSEYQNSPPKGHEDWATMDNRTFFYEYTQSAFIPTGDDVKIEITKPIPDFCLRVLARMMGYSEGPYADQATYDAVYAAYQKYMESGKYALLCEPLLSFKNTGGNGVVNKIFGEGTTYIAMSSAEVGIVDDCMSGILYGYTNSSCIDSEDDDGNDFNYFSGDGSPTHDASRDLFNSLLMAETDWGAKLWSIYDDGITDSTNGAKHFFDSYVPVTSTDNFYRGSISTDDLGDALSGNASDGTIDKANYWNSIFYYQVYKDILGKDAEYNASTAKSYSLGSYPDPASLINIGGMAEIKPVWSSVDIKTNLVGVGEISDTVNSLPVYDDSYSIDSNGDAAVTIKATTQLNFDDNATQWNDKVVVDINNGGVVEDEERGDEPTLYAFTCSSTADSGSYRYAHDQGESEIEGQNVYIPGYTKNEITITYADSEGKALDNFQQVTGSTSSAGSSVIVDADQPLASKMFLDNISLLGWNPNASSTDEKAIPFVMSVRNAIEVMRDDGISSDYLVDSNEVDGAALSSNNNIDISDTTSDSSGYITFKAPNYEDVPEGAEYFLVTLKSNIGNVQAHGFFYGIGIEEIDDKRFMPSRPQYNKEIAESLGSDTGKYYAIYTDETATSCYRSAVGSGLETDFTNNTAQILVPIIEREYDVSADEISINYSTVSTRTDPADESTARDHLTSLCLTSAGSATEEVIFLSDSRSLRYIECRSKCSSGPTDTIVEWADICFKILKTDTE